MAQTLRGVHEKVARKSGSRYTPLNRRPYRLVGPGRGPFKAATRVRIPLGTLKSPALRAGLFLI